MMPKHRDKTHYRAKDNKPGSLCGKLPPRYRHIIFVKWRKNVTCSHCAKKLRVFKSGKPKPPVKMYPPWELPIPNELQVLAATERGIKSHASILIALDKRIETNPQIITGTKG